MSFAPDQRFKVPADVMARTVDGAAVVLDLVSGTYFGLNDVGTVVFHALQEGAALREIEARVAAEFHVDAGRAATDIDAMLAALVAKRLVVPV